MSHPIALCLVITAALLSLSASPAAGSHTDKRIRWTADQSPYLLTEDFVVPYGTVLTIDPGVHVQASAGVSLVIVGQMDARGTSTEPIAFSAPEGRWGGIRIQADEFYYRSTLEFVSIEDAHTALLIKQGAADISQVDVHDNITGIRFENPTGDAAVYDSRLFQNRTAMSGYTRNVISVKRNDLWANRINIKAEPEPMFDCGPDDGVWSISDNDILRGPEQADFFSHDMRTPAGSATSRYNVIADNNWWGTSDEDRLWGRFGEEFDCCPGPSEKGFLVSPISVSPHTAWEPTGEVPDPDPPTSSTHGDPGAISAVDHPVHGACIRSRRLHEIRGAVYPAVGGRLRVSLTICRRTPGGCVQLQPEPFAPTGYGRLDYGRSWFWRLPKSLERGRYIFTSDSGTEPMHLGRNRVAFSVR
jgi:hypothetical protein